jgi:hypothetical protein
VIDFVQSIHASLIALAVLAAPSPDRTDCSTVGARYAAAVAKVIETLHSYEKCVASSEKRTDCAAEMQALDSAHDDFADAVDDAKECQ